jgi:two-component system, OmpR family, copper resistance phosphate regulon response regulator CusR
MRILIIEDDLELSKFLKNALESHLFTVDCTDNGEKGIFLARTNPYKVIILDYILPTINGEQILEELREKDNQAPILVLTAKSSLDDKKTMFSKGADDYLVKPFIFEELLMRINALIRRPEKIQENIISLGDLSLNQQTKIVKRKKENINLTKKQYNLLEFLLLRKGEIISRMEIMENVWDINADPFSNSIEAHIMQLRKKINKNKYINYIHTIAGRGYKLDLKKF